MRSRLSPRGRYAHDDITKKPVLKMSQGSFALGERQDVRGFVFFSIYPVELSNRIVARENDRKLGVPHLQDVEHRPRATLHVHGRHALVRTFLHHEPHRHRANLT